jgi:hypothetical protein
MSIQIVTDERLAQLEKHLVAQVILSDRSPTFDMQDGPEKQVLEPFPELYSALQFLDQKVTTPWREADQKALRSQSQHRFLAQTAIVTGTAAIVLAVVQLSIKLTWHQLTGIALVLEAAAVIAAVVAVAVGLTAKYNREWLGHRHLAEQLRMLKFRALGEIWRFDPAHWQKWVEEQFDEVKGSAEFERVAQWSEEGEVEPYDPRFTSSTLDPHSATALTIYYRVKRLDFQANYFKSRHDSYTRQTGRWLHLSLPLFLASVFCVLAHFGAEFWEGRLKLAGDEHGAAFWYNISIWCVALAAVIPVLGIGVRAWFAALELPRSASLFAAKHRALVRASAHLHEDSNDLGAMLRHIAQSEHFLEHEHREWLRLLSDSEWFL